MIFGDKANKALQLARERNLERAEIAKRKRQVWEAEHEGSENPEEASPFDPNDEVPMKERLEKGDMFAMIMAGFLTILPVALVVLVALSLLGYFFLMR
ncbi:MAG: hypothetical protein RRY79_00370 [Clostridia bacterium]